MAACVISEVDVGLGNAQHDHVLLRMTHFHLKAGHSFLYPNNPRPDLTKMQLAPILFPKNTHLFPVPKLELRTIAPANRAFGCEI
jgi:hypothetical protein